MLVRLRTVTTYPSLSDVQAPSTMIRKCSAIRDHFDVYTRLIGKQKLIEAKVIELDDNGGLWIRRNEVVSHDTEEQILFGAAKQKNGAKYGLKIFIKSLHDEPVYYFDSDGPAHFNADSDSGLSGSKIPTPHINYYDSGGYKCAFRSEFIEQNVSSLQSSINFGMKYFCSEVNLNTDTHLPEIRENVQTNLFDEKSDDVHNGVNFDDEQ